MKRIFILLPLILLINCGPEAPVFDRNYSIENSTNLPVELFFYNRSSRELKENQLLLAGESFNGKAIEFHEPHSVFPEDDYPSISYGSDSLVLIFNNEKKITFVNAFTESQFFSPPVNRNVFRQGNYENISGNNYLFKITQEDFESALLCEADCE